MLSWFRKWFARSDRAVRNSVKWNANFMGSPALVVNQSLTGMYIEVEKGAPIGSTIKFTVTIPDHQNHKNVLKMAYEGRIVRAEKNNNRLGLGIELTKPVKLEDDSETSPLWRKVK